MHFSVTCPDCDTEFPVDSEKVPPDGVHAICSTCEGIFLVERPTEAGEEPEAPPEESQGWDEEETLATEEPEPEAAADEEPSEVESAQQFDQFFEPVLGEEEEEEEEEAPAEAEEEDEWSSFGDDLTLTDEAEGAAAVEEEEAAEEATEAEAPAAEAPRFGQRDPEEKAARLARVLVQDMIAYNQEMYQKALEQGTLEEDFETEVQKSWEEYVERIGKEIATSTTYFKDALNEILAKGEEVFDGPP